MSETTYSVYGSATNVVSPQTGQFFNSNSKESFFRLAVVIPTNNNELSIGSLVLLARQHAAHVIVVDDSSSDKTVDIAIQAGADVLSTGPSNRGKVQSILLGCKRALGYDCSTVVLLDSGDLHLTQEISRLATPVFDGSADLVIGSRNLTGRAPNPLPATPLIDPLSRTADHSFHSSDPNSSFRALSVRSICSLDLLPDSDQFQSSMVLLLSRKGLKVVEIPIKAGNDDLKSEADKMQLYRGKKIAVVIPAHNEELLISDTLAGIPDFVAKIYVVNDCSTDKTQEVIECYAKRNKAIVPIRHEVNRGAGAAIVSGYEQALKDGADIIATMDGDNQMDPTFLPQFLDPIIDGKCDFTMGNRLVNREFRKGMSTWRFFGNATLTLLTKIASGYWSMVDPQNGFTAISKRAVEKIDFKSMYPRYGYLNDRLARLNVYGFRVVNISHPSRYGKEKSGIKYGRYIYRLSGLLFKTFIKRLETKYVMLNFHPLIFFYIGGMLLVAISVALGAYSFFSKLTADIPIFVPGVVTLILLSMGLQSLFLAMFFDMAQEKSNNGLYA